MDLKNYSDGKYTYGDLVLQLVYLNCLFLQVLRIFRPEIPNLIHLLQCACVHFSGAGRSIFISLHQNHSFIEQQLLNRPVLSPKLELCM